MARSRAEASTGGSACWCARQWLACAFRRFASLLLQGASLFWIALSWCAKLGREKRVARTIFHIVIAGHKARSAVFLSDDPAIHAECRLAEISRSVWRAARQHGPPGQARRPSEIAPPLGIYPRRELVNPFPDDPECEKEWAAALLDCWKLKTNKQLGRGDNRGSGRTFDQCVRGRVSERCGGNPTA